MTAVNVDPRITYETAIPPSPTEAERTVIAMRQAREDLSILQSLLGDIPQDDAHRAQREAVTDELHRLTVVVNAMLLATYPRPRIVTAPLDRSVPWMW